jgi:hypothetical protein
MGVFLSSLHIVILLGPGWDWCRLTSNFRLPRLSALLLFLFIIIIIIIIIRYNVPCYPDDDRIACSGLGQFIHSFVTLGWGWAMFPGIKRNLIILFQRSFSAFPGLGRGGESGAVWMANCFLHGYIIWLTSYLSAEWWHLSVVVILPLNIFSALHEGSNLSVVKS